MPAKSKKQQRFMGMVHAIQKGEIDPSGVSKDMRDAADSISYKDAKDFAETSHKGLPTKVTKKAELQEPFQTAFRSFDAFLRKQGMRIATEEDLAKSAGIAPPMPADPMTSTSAKEQLAYHNQKMYRASKEYLKKRLRDRAHRLPMEAIVPSSQLEKNALRFPKFKLPSKQTMKEVGKKTGIAFAAGSAAANIGSAITYPIDTRNVRQQTGQEMPKTLREHYSGFGTKVLKNTLTIGTAFALQDPIKRLITKALIKK